MGLNSTTKKKNGFALSARLLNSLPRLVILIVIGVGISFISPYFLTSKNLVNVLAMSSIPIIFAFAQTIVILTGEIDLSIGAIMAISGVVSALIIKFLEVPLPLAVLAGLAVGGLMGYFNGLLISKVKLPSFIATYGLRIAITGFAIAILKGYVVYGYPENFRFVGVGRWGNIPVIIFVMLLVLVIMWVVLNRTTFGRRIYAVGANDEAAMMSGIDVGKTKILVFVIAGVLAACAGILQVSRLNAAESSSGAAMLLPAIAAVVIGGTSMFGGEGGVIGTVIGALIMNVIQNGLNLIGAPSILQQFIVGLIILFAVIVDQTVRNMTEKRLQ